jgi:Lambda phage tail tube protein, TTP
MTFNPTHSFGTQLQTDTTGGTTYATIAEVQHIGGPNIQFSDTDWSFLTMSVPFRNFMAGLGNGGEVDFTCLFDQAQLAALYTAAGNRATLNWKILFPLVGTQVNNAYWSLTGYIKEIGNDFPEDNKITCPFKVKVSGKPGFTQGS